MQKLILIDKNELIKNGRYFWKYQGLFLEASTSENLLNKMIMP